VGDFAGSIASRRTLVIITLAFVEGLGLVIGAVTAALSGEPIPSGEVLAWGTVAGVSSFVGLGLFFAAMARGMISIVTPVAALVSAAIPAVIGVSRGETLQPPQLIGMVLALIAVAVISRPLEGESAGQGTLAGGGERRPASSGTVVGLAILAGLGFAGFFLSMDNAKLAGGDVWWSIVAARATASVMVLATLVMLRTVPRAPMRVVPLLVIAAAGDVGGILFFNMAIATGQLSLAVVLSSMYPVITTILAWLVLRERLGRAHLTAVILALVGVVLIAL
jgi:drug/metabolite transporter (DMT)-like permease